MSDETQSPEPNEPVKALSGPELSDDESRMLQTMLRSSHYNIRGVVIHVEASPPTVTITVYDEQPQVLDYKTAIEMDDNAWRQFFDKQQPESPRST